MFRKIKRSKVSDDKTYLYSGLASLIYPAFIEKITGEQLKEIEPNAVGKAALLVAESGIIDYKQTTKKFAEKIFYYFKFFWWVKISTRNF